MATFYLDMYGGGSDANDGLTPATPKATLNAATALVTAVTDEIRVRGVDSLFTSVGNATWTDKSNDVIMTGDTTGSVAVGDYICKTIVASGTTMPRLYLVASRSYAAGTNLTTIVLTNTTNCFYEGTTETVSTSKISLAQTIALQDFGRNGQTSGTAASWTRVDTQITGGWNSGYTAQNSFTLCYNTANASNFSVINNNLTRRQYWHLKRFIVFNGNQFSDIYQTYCSFTDSVFIGLAARRNIIASTCIWLIFNNCYFYHASINYNFMINSADNMYMNNCYIHNSINRVTLDNDMSSYNNTVFVYGNSLMLNTVTTSTFNSCRFRFAGATFSTNLSTNVFNNCTWELTASACDLGTATISGGTYTNTTGAFTNTGVVTGLSGYTTTSTFTNAGNFIDNYLSGTSVTFASAKTNVPSIISGNTGVNVGINNSYGLFYENTGFDLATSAQLYGGTIIYDSNNDIDKTKFARIADNLSAPYIYQPQNTVWMQSPSGNTIFYNGGFIDLTTDVYTGKTNYSGTSALRLYNTLNHATDSVFRTVDFNVEAGATGYTSFWVKGNTGILTIDYNIMNDGKFIWNTWKQFGVTTLYQNLKLNLTGTTFSEDGIATLWFRIPSRAAGTILYVDNIGLYSGSTTNNIIQAYPISGLTAKWDFSVVGTGAGKATSTNGLYTFTGDTIYDELTGRPARAVQTDGTFNCKLNNVAFDNVLKDRNPFTIAFWQKRNNSTSSIVTWKYGTNLSLTHTRPVSTHLYTFTRGSDSIISSISYPDDWIHFVLVYDGTYMRFYMNNAQVGSDTSSTSNVATGDLFLGVAGYGNYIDSYYVYNRALSALEISVLYNNGNGI